MQFGMRGEKASVKKQTIVLISLGCTVVFVALVYYGLRHARGVPTQIGVSEKVVLEVPYRDEAVDLGEGLSRDVWESIPAVPIKLHYQVTALPWPKGVVSGVEVKAFHNQETIYFRMEWQDETEDRLHRTNQFPDASALMFPLGEDVKSASIMMGFLGRANIWHWKANHDKHFWWNQPEKDDVFADFHYPFEDEEVLSLSKEKPVSAVRDMAAKRIATLTPRDSQDVKGRGAWEDGSWQVVFQRSLVSSDKEWSPSFAGGSKRLCAFAVWDGQRGDRGGRKSISDWIELAIL